MTERWRRELGRLSEIGPDDELLERARSTPPRSGLPSRRSSVVVIVVALAVFASAGAFAWLAFDPGATTSNRVGMAYPSPPASGHYVLLPDRAVQLDAFDVQVTAVTNLPDGTLLQISTSTTGICCPPVEGGEVTFDTQDSSCFGMAGDIPDGGTFEVTITARPSFEGFPSTGLAGESQDPPEQPEAVLLALGQSFENLSGAQVETQEDSSNWLVASGVVPWPEPRCGGDPIPLFGGPDCEADEAQLQGEDLGDAMSEVMGAIGQGRMCEFWSQMVPPDVRQQHPWAGFASEWRVWLSRQDFSDVELGGDWMSGELRWTLVGSVGELGAGESYVMEVIHGDRPIARLTMQSLEDHCPECSSDVVPFWGVTSWDLDPAVVSDPGAAFGWCPEPPFPEAGAAWREESADAALRFVEAYADGDTTGLAQVLDASVPPGTVFPVVAGGRAVGFNFSGGMLVRTACGADVDAYTAAVTMDDGTTSASMDFTVYLVLRADGWKVWAVY